MSTTTRASKAKSFKLHLTLEGADNFEQWTKALQGQLFSLIRNTNMNNLTSASTLDDDYFKKHSDFSSDYKDASKNADGERQHPFEDAEFLQACLEEAINTGLGFQDWVYDADTAVRASLSEQISSKLSAPMGDFVGMLQQVAIAVGHIEVSDPTDLEHKYSNCTMESCGNDFMEYTARLATYLRRLKAAGEEVSDKKKQRTLIRGLHEGVFGAFIEFADEFDWDDYDHLLSSTIKKAGLNKTLAKLNALKPGTHSAFATRACASTKTSHDRRLDRMEALLLTTADKPKRAAKGECWTRNCTNRNCRFTHPEKKGEDRGEDRRKRDGGRNDRRQRDNWLLSALRAAPLSPLAHLAWVSRQAVA